MTENLNKILSCILKTRDEVLINRLDNICELLMSYEDLTVDYEILIKWFVNSYNLSLLQRNYEMEFKRSLLEDKLSYTLMNKINSYATTNNTRILWGVAGNINVPKDKEDFCQLVAMKVLELYDLIDGLEISVTEAMNYFDFLLQELKSYKFRQVILSLTEQFNKAQDIDDVITKGSVSFKELSSITEDEEVKDLTSITNMRASEGRGITLETLSGLGFESPVSIYNRSICTIIGDEGVGKTNFLINIIVENLINGNSVLFFRGESPEYKIENMVLASFIKKTLGASFDWKELVNLKNLDENVRKKVELAKVKLSELKGHLYVTSGSKKVVDVDTFEVLVKKYQVKYDIKLVAIDHVGLCKASISKRLTIQERISELYKIQIDLKDKNLSFLNLSHTDTDASKGKDKSVRIGALSSATTKDADLVIYLKTDEELKLQHIIKVIFKKVREWEGIVRELLIKQDFGSSFTVVEDMEENVIDNLLS